LKAKNYTPGSAMRLLGQLGSAATTLSYSAAAAKLEDDLHVAKSHLSNIKLIIDNPAFADTISV
jgi:hypothetical protein